MTMVNTQLTADAIQYLPDVADEFNKQALAAVRDVRARPGNEKPREVCIKFQFLPGDDQDELILKTSITSKTPAKSFAPLACKTNSKSQMYFQWENLDNDD